MTTTLAQLDIEQAAKEAAGNWCSFDCFSWHRAAELDDADEWTIVYTHHRDSGLVDQSNAEAIRKIMQPFVDREPCDVLEEHDHHWAVAWIEGFAIRVYRRGRITKAFRAWHELSMKLADYPLLDEDDYFARVYEATIENISNAVKQRDYAFPRGWEAKVYRWLADHDPSEIEGVDSWPSDDALRRAFDALGFTKIE